MKICVNDLDLEKIHHLLDVKEINMSIADMLFHAYEEKDVFHSGNIYNQLIKYWNAKDERKILDKWVKNSIREIDYRYFLNNPYYQNVKPLPYKMGDYSLKYDMYEAYQVVPFDDIKVDKKDFKEITPIAYFPSQVPYLSLSYKNEIWMCITPNEIETMQPAIAKAKGNVLVMGLGLGYYPYMVSLKEEVKDIYIVEIDKTIIALFNKCLLPHFPHPEKIHIYYDDALRYLKNTDKTFDTTFVDLWHNPFDALPIYQKVRRLEEKHISQYSYWLETSILALARRCMLTIIEESLDNYDDSCYQSADNPIDEFINELYFKTKNITISSYDDIHKLLLDDNLRLLFK